jgi:YfiR/HmsC-like
LNFTKYVEWPDAAFEQADAPITIGVVGENHFGEDLKKSVEGKSVNGRKIIIVPLETESDWSKCRILFISGSEKKRLAEIMAKVGTLPVLTVGETEQFTQQGGMVNFTRKDGKVRLEINLTAAEKAKVGISSKLLSVADVVRGKP